MAMRLKVRNPRFETAWSPRKIPSQSVKLLGCSCSRPAPESRLLGTAWHVRVKAVEIDKRCEWKHICRSQPGTSGLQTHSREPSTTASSRINSIAFTDNGRFPRCYQLGTGYHKGAVSGHQDSPETGPRCEIATPPMTMSGSRNNQRPAHRGIATSR